MIDYYLRFETEEQALEVADTYLQHTNERYAVDVVGTIYEHTGEGDSATSTPLPGFHVNLRLMADDAVLPLEFDQFVVSPTKPYRVWA